MTKHTILFLAANPSGTDPRALDREARSIRAELRRSGYRDRFEFETRWAVEPLDLLRELRELRPAVVHFSGRGGPDGLVFQAADGGASWRDTTSEGGRLRTPITRWPVRSTCDSSAGAHTRCSHGAGPPVERSLLLHGQKDNFLQ